MKGCPRGEDPCTIEQVTKTFLRAYLRTRLREICGAPQLMPDCKNILTFLQLKHPKTSTKQIFYKGLLLKSETQAQDKSDTHTNGT